MDEECKVFIRILPDFVKHRTWVTGSNHSLASTRCTRSPLYYHSFSYSVCIGQPEDRKFFRRQSLQCLILDEGHMLKNMTSQRYSYLMKMKVIFNYEWLLVRQEVGQWLGPRASTECACASIAYT